MRQALIGLAVAALTMLALAGPASAVPGQVTHYRVDIGGDPLQDRGHPGQVGRHVRPAGMIAVELYSYSR